MKVATVIGLCLVVCVVNVFGNPLPGSEVAEIDEAIDSPALPPPASFNRGYSFAYGRLRDHPSYIGRPQALYYGGYGYRRGYGSRYVRGYEQEHSYGPDGAHTEGHKYEQDGPNPEVAAGSAHHRTDYGAEKAYSQGGHVSPHGEGHTAAGHQKAYAKKVTDYSTKEIGHFREYAHIQPQVKPEPRSQHGAGHAVQPHSSSSPHGGFPADTASPGAYPADNVAPAAYPTDSAAPGAYPTGVPSSGHVPVGGHPVNPADPVNGDPAFAPHEGGKHPTSEYDDNYQLPAENKYDVPNPDSLSEPSYSNGAETPYDAPSGNAYPQGGAQYGAGAGFGPQPSFPGTYGGVDLNNFGTKNAYPGYGYFGLRRQTGGNPYYNMGTPFGQSYQHN